MFQLTHAFSEKNLEKKKLINVHVYKALADSGPEHSEQAFLFFSLKEKWKFWGIQQEGISNNNGSKSVAKKGIKKRRHISI